MNMNDCSITRQGFIYTCIFRSFAFGFFTCRKLLGLKDVKGRCGDWCRGGPVVAASCILSVARDEPRTGKRRTESERGVL